MKNKILFIFFLISVCIKTQAKVQASDTTEERGRFSLSALVGIGDSRVLNVDADYSSYRGYSIGLEGEFHLFVYQQTQLRLFTRYLTSEQTGKVNTSETLYLNQSLAGLKVFIGPYFYIGIGYGNNMTRFKTSSNDFLLNNMGPTQGLGAEFKVKDGFYMGLHGWYSNAPLKYELPLTSNSYIESGTLFLSFTWSPSSYTTVIKSSKAP